MKKIIKILLISIIPIFTIIVFIMYQIQKESSYEPIDFDLFITKSFFKNHKESPWDEVSHFEKRPIQWLINKSEFEKLDSIYLGFQNISDEKIYYMTWGAPNSRIRDHYIVYKNGEIDSIPFTGFGCGTGIYLTPLKNKKIAGSKLINPLLFNPYTGYHLPLKNKKFPKLFKSLYGDSVAIKFQQATYSLPWNRYPSQMIESKQVVISTDKIIKNWKKGNFKLNIQFEKEHELSFYTPNKN